MHKLLAFWDRQKWVDKLGDKIKPRLDRLLEKTGDKQKAADLLNGVWLGHPLHPVLVALPIGAWSTAALFDTLSLLKGEKSSSATGMIAFGIVSAIPTAAAGAADWKHLSGKTARLGGGHALMNSTALGFYGLSLLARMNGHSGRLPAMLGLALVSASGYIGGHLVYSEQVGVKHMPNAEAPEQFSAVTQASDVAEGSLQRVDVEGVPVLLARVNGRVHALSDVCTHLGCSLADGSLEGEEIVCPCHSSRFSVIDGRVTAGPATMPLDTYDLRVVDGEVEIREKVATTE